MVVVAGLAFGAAVFIFVDRSPHSPGRGWTRRRSRGHDVESVASNPDREALSDAGVLALARAEHRAVVTNNLRDFRPLHHEAVTPGGGGHTVANDCGARGGAATFQPWHGLDHATAVILTALTSQTLNAELTTPESGSRAGIGRSLRGAV